MTQAFPTSSSRTAGRRLLRPWIHVATICLVALALSSGCGSDEHPRHAADCVGEDCAKPGGAVGAGAGSDGVTSDDGGIADEAGTDGASDADADPFAVEAGGADVATVCPGTPPANGGPCNPTSVTMCVYSQVTCVCGGLWSCS